MEAEETRLDKVVATMKMVADDCVEDAKNLDHTHFSPRGVGEALGGMLAMISAVAKSTAIVAEELAKGGDAQ